MTRRRRETGSASVLGVQVLTALAVLTLVAAGVAALVLDHRRAQAAADLGALAGATAIQEGGDPCPDAARVVTRNRARLTSCRLSGQQVWVAVVVRSPPILGQRRTLAARAHAGPAEGSAGGAYGRLGPGP